MVDSVVLGMVLGGLVPLAGYLLAICADNRAVSRARKKRDGNSAAVLSMSVATIANDLVPLIRKLDNLKGGKIRVVGSDGRYVVKRNGRSWRDGILEWTEAGLEVSYVLLGPGEGVQDELVRLSREADERNAGEGQGRLRVYVLQDECSEEAASMADELRTFHPTLFAGADGRKAMWLEGIHEADAEYAYNVRYVSPSAMSDELEEEYGEYDGKIDTLMENCKEMGISAAEHGPATL